MTLNIDLAVAVAFITWACGVLVGLGIMINRINTVKQCLDDHVKAPVITCPSHLAVCNDITRLEENQKSLTLRVEKNEASVKDLYNKVG